MSNSLWPHGPQHTRPPYPSPTLRELPKLMSIKSVMSCNHLFFFHSLLLSSIFPSIRIYSNESVLHIRWPKYWSFSLSISSFNEYSGLLPLGLTDLISLLSKGSQESFPTPQFKNINSSVLSFLYSPSLTSIHDYLKNHSFDQMDLSWQSSVSKLLHLIP